MNPKAVSVESLAMLCPDQYRAKHLLTIASPDQTSCKTIVVNALRRSKRRAKHFDHDRDRARCQARGGSGYDTETLQG
jgi:hypothetical protein